MTNLPPALLQPPPRHPAGAAQLLASPSNLTYRRLGGAWVCAIVVGGLLVYGDADILLSAVIAAAVGLLISVPLLIGMMLASQRGQALYTHALFTPGRVRAVQPNLSPDFPAKIDIDFQDTQGQWGIGRVSIAWSKVSWLTPGMPVTALYVPGNRKLFGVYVDTLGIVPGKRSS